jgi:hypothetical protein
MDSIECSICTEELPLRCFTYNEQVDVFRTSCGHSFHMSCISRWCQTNNNCPICRKKNIYNLSNSVHRQNGFNVNSYIIYDVIVSNDNNYNINSYINNHNDNINNDNINIIINNLTNNFNN